MRLGVGKGGGREGGGTESKCMADMDHGCVGCIREGSQVQGGEVAFTPT